MTHYTTLVQRCRATNSLLADEIDREFRRLETMVTESHDKWEECLKEIDRQKEHIAGLQAALRSANAETTN